MAVSITLTDTDFSENTVETTVTFFNMSFGDEAGGRIIYVAAINQLGKDVASVSIGGEAAQFVFRAESSFSDISFYRASPAETLGDVVIEYGSDNQVSITIYVLRVIGANQATPESAMASDETAFPPGASSLALAIDILADGGLIAVSGGGFDAADTINTTWTNATEADDTVVFVEGDSVFAANSVATRETSSALPAEMITVGTNATTAPVLTLALVAIQPDDSLAGTGSLVSQSATMSGSGVVSSVGSGSLVAQSATMAGVGATGTTGSGSLVAQSATLSGVGTISAPNTGELVAQSATMAGVGTTGSVGTGDLQAGSATMVGVGDAVLGVGDLVAQSATMAGSGSIPASFTMDATETGVDTMTMAVVVPPGVTSSDLSRTSVSVVEEVEPPIAALVSVTED